MSEVVSLRMAPDSPAAAATAPAQAAIGGPIMVERVPAAVYATWGEVFEDLARRDPCANPFMAPAVVAARRGRLGDRAIVILAAWQEAAQERRLVGVWVLARRRDVWSGFLPVLQTPLEPRHDTSGAPVLDAAHARAAMAALIEAAFGLPGLPRAIRAGAWPQALSALLPASCRAAMAERWSRSVLMPADAASLWELPRVRKRLKQERSLKRAGRLDHLALRGAEAQRGIAIFLAIEASGWKGAAGTALARREADRTDLVAVFEAFAAADRLSIDVLMLDGEPIAAGVMIEAGDGQVFWRTAYDERFARHSPGVMLDLAVTRRVLSQGRAFIDSGMGPFTRPESQIWPGRLDFAHVTLAPRRSWRASVVSAGARLRLALRTLKYRYGG